ncbi:MAG: hypothetical protein ACLQOO_36455 [Terriglobia bacterium]
MTIDDCKTRRRSTDFADYTTFLMGGLYHKLEWVRMAGDLTFILVGAVPIALGVLRSVWKRDVAPAL